MSFFLRVLHVRSIFVCFQCNVEWACSAAPCSCIISVPEPNAWSLLYLYTVMVMEKAAWLNLIPQLCLTPLTWDHLLSPLPWLMLCSFSSFAPAAPPFSAECSRCWEAVAHKQWLTNLLYPLFIKKVKRSVYFCHT